ncbi:hypothetical protein ACLB2K_031315 [Fragaria x ananassa]
MMIIFLMIMKVVAKLMRPVLDPPCAKTKGMSNVGWKSSVEKRNKNASKNKVSSSKNGDAAKQQKQKQSEDPVLSGKGNIEKQKNRASKNPVSSSKKVCTRSSTINMQPCLPLSNQVLNSYSSCHAQSNSNSSNPSPLTMSTSNYNQFYPPMNLSAINIQGFLPPPNQVSSLHIPYDSNSDSMALVVPNSSFTSMLLSQVGEDMEETIDCKFYILEAN